MLPTEFSICEVPQPLSDAQRRKRYRARNGAKVSQSQYLSRKFIAWDGEGGDIKGRHTYFLLSNSLGETITNKAGLGRAEIADMVLNTKVDHPTALHVVYGGGYDFQFWFGDINKETLQQLYLGKRVTIGRHRYRWRVGKNLEIKDTVSGRLVTVYDVMPFFQCSFVKACDDYLGSNFVMRDEIVSGKSSRGSFDYADIAEITRYNDAELVNLVALVEELRLRLERVGIRPRRWDGPGAIATALLTSKGVKEALGPRDREEDVMPWNVAARHAYAGGRFEPIRLGAQVPGGYEYDINSAYPHALQSAPCLTHGYWKHRDGEPELSHDFVLRRVEFSAYYDARRWHHRPFPFFYRLPTGLVYFPFMVKNWVWEREYQAGKRLAKLAYPGSMCRSVESWEWVSSPDKCIESGCNPYPFDWIGPYFLKRKALKKAKDGAHVGIKLGLNSLYGKLAQRTGAEYKDGRWRIPPFHNLAWAGYVTSTCRSMLLDATCLDPDSVIAYATDAIFSVNPLGLDIGDDLGQWEATEFRHLTYTGSGIYFYTDSAGNHVERTRGVDRGTLHESDFLEAIERDGTEGTVAAPLTRFYGAGLALSQNWEYWRSWRRTDKEIRVTPGVASKRFHAMPELGEHACPACNLEGRFTIGEWHNTMIGMKFPIGSFEDLPMSTQHQIPWIPTSIDGELFTYHDDELSAKEIEYDTFN